MDLNIDQNLMNSARSTTSYMRIPARTILRAMVLVNLDEFSSRLLEFRNTPNLSGKSPAQMFFGRRLRGKLPHLPGANDLDITNAKAGADHRKQLMEQRETLSGTNLKPLSVNQKVLVQNPITKSWNDQGVITSV